MPLPIQRFLISITYLFVDCPLQMYSPVDLCKHALQLQIPVRLLSDQIHSLCQQYPCNKIDDVMLLRNLRGNTYQNCKNTGKTLVPNRNFLLSSYAYKTKPADQTMNGWKQICRRINRINQIQHLIPDPGFGYFGPCQSCRNHYKEDSANDS